MISYLGSAIDGTVSFEAKQPDILALSFSGCVILGKAPEPAEPQSLHPYNGESNRTYIIGLWKLK